MENLKYKAKAAFFMSLLSTLAALVVLGCWYFGTLELAVVTPETFIGITVALLAIIVTIAVGWQVWAAMDLKSNIAKLDSRIQEVENIRDQFKKQEQDMKQLHYEAQHFSHIAIAETFRTRNLFVDAFRFYMSALKCGLKLTQPINLQHMVNSMMECANLIVGNPEINERTQDNILINDESIRKSPLFRVVQDDYEKAYSLFKRKVKLNDKQK